MKLLRRNGQSIGEYAIMLGIVLGAVFSVQNYIRNRILGGIQATAEHYHAPGSTAAVTIDDEFRVTTESSSRSQSTVNFTEAVKGESTSGSLGTSTTTNPKDE